MFPLSANLEAEHILLIQSVSDITIWNIINSPQNILPIPLLSVKYVLLQTSGVQQCSI